MNEELKVYVQMSKFDKISAFFQDEIINLIGLNEKVKGVVELLTRG